MKELVGQGKPFYSAIDKAAGLLKRKVGTGAEFMQELKGLGGIKQSEIEDRGLGELMGAPKMTHEQFMAALAAKPAPAIQEKVFANKLLKNPGSDPDPHHEKWTLPGGDNYREMLIKAPEGVDNQEKIMEMEAKARRMPMINSTPEQQAELTNLFGQIKQLKDQEKEQRAKQFGGVNIHFEGEPNILASMRLKDRAGPNGEKLLHLEELQSDWHQQGRQHGYRTPESEKEKEELENQIDQLKRDYEAGNLSQRDYLDKRSTVQNKLVKLVADVVPDAPFKKNWEEMALKRLIHHAAEKGYHGIVVTPGAEQADRYGLAKHIGMMSYNPEDQHFQAFKPNRETAISERGATPERVSELVGKELAQKLMSAPKQMGHHYIEGDDIKVGGEGMKTFYDTKVPNILNTIGKKYGVKTELGGHTIYGRGRERTEEEFRQATQNVPFERHKEFDYEPKPIPLHYFPINEQMRKDVLTNGLPLHKEGGIIHKAVGGTVQPSMNQMRAELIGKKPTSLSDLSTIGANEAPNMNVKVYVPPSGGQLPVGGVSMGNQPLPIGGIDMSQGQQGNQLMPASLIQPPQPPQGQPPQAGGMPSPLSAGASSPAQQPPSNILQMTPQGQALNAMSPPKMADGGSIPMTYKVGGSDNMPEAQPSWYQDNGESTFNIDNIQQLAKGGSAHYNPAPALSKQEIEAMAERMARQMAGLDNPNKKTIKQLAREQDLPIEISKKKKIDVPVINYEELKGASTVGVPGDPSRGGVIPSKRNLSTPKAGEVLHAIGGEKLENPVPLYGGKDYGAYGHNAGWASDLGASAGLFNVVKRLAEENPDSKVLGHYHKMTPESLNHAVHMLDAVISHHQPHKADPERIAVLNHLMRKVATTKSKHDVPYPEFPGFENPADVMLHGAVNSGLRKKLIGLLSTEKHFPGGKQKMDDIIFALSHPELRNIETGAGGSAILQFDPTKELKENISPHPTYAHDIPSKLIGKSRYLTPAEILAPRSMHNARREIAAMGKKVVPFNQAKMNIIREPIDEQYINQMGAYEQAMKKRLGYKKGGKVKLSTNMDTINLELSRKSKKAK